jgi:thiamine transport system ATP-binding protein
VTGDANDRREPDAGASRANEPRRDEPTPGVELDGVRVTFDGVTALRDVSIAVRDGEFFTLVGPSGCGKTTTLRAIAGFETPVAGTVRIGGRDVAGLPPEDRDVGVVFQNYALFPTMNVRENVGYALEFRDAPGGASRRERVDELLELVDMTGMADRDPGALSGGQQQRVALARALAPGPEVLLLDEPLSALDARLRERLRMTVRRIQRDLDITTVYVTHDQAEALAVSDRVAVMTDGRIEQVGTPETVYREPATRFVASFVGDNSLLDAEVTATDPPTATVTTGGSGGEEPAGPGDADARPVDLALPVDADVRRGEQVTLCIRPENVGVEPGDGTGTASARTTDAGGRTALDATVESVEFLGHAYRVHCSWGGREVLATVPATGRSEPPGGDVRLWIAADAVHVLRD